MAIEGNIQRDDFLKILEDLINIPSPFGYEEKIGDFCSNYLENNNFVINRDEIGNIMAIRRQNGDDSNFKYPMLCAHLDTLDGDHDTEYNEEELKHKSINIEDYIENEDNIEIITDEDLHFGFDNKVGIALILLICKMKQDVPLKVLLTVQEEHNQNGARQIPDNFYLDVMYAICIDRMNSDNIVTEYQEKVLCSEDFAQQIVNFGDEIPLEITKGGYRADALAIAYGSDEKFIAPSMRSYETRDVRRINCVNLSAGVYGDHEKGDSCKINESLKIGDVLIKILAN